MQMTTSQITSARVRSAMHARTRSASRSVATSPGGGAGVPTGTLAVLIVAFLTATATVADSSDSDLDALYRAKKAGELEVLARERLAANPKDDVALWYWGRAVKQDGKKRQEMIARAEQCIAERPQSAHCHNLLANLIAAVASSEGISAAFRYAGRLKDTYLRAVELNPRQFAFRRDLNQFYLNAPGMIGGSVRKAVKSSEDLSKLDAARGNVLRAEVHVYEDEFDDAEALLAAIRPGNDVELADAVQSVTTDLGLALVDDGQAGRAQKLFERQIAGDPRYATAHLGLGRALLEQKKLDASIAALGRALQLDPTVRAHYRLGIAHQSKGDADNALAMFRHFLTYSPHGRAADDTRKRIEQLTKRAK